MGSATSIRATTKNPLPPASPLPPSHPIGGGSDSRGYASSPDENADRSCSKVFNSIFLMFIILSVVLFAFVHIFFYGSGSSTTAPSQRYNQPFSAVVTARKLISAERILNQSCSVTLYPEFCLSSLSHLPGVRGAVTEKEILVASVMEAARLAKKAYIKFDGILLREGKRRRIPRRGALNDCVQMMDLTISNLGAVLSHLGNSPSGHQPPAAAANGSSLFSWNENEVKEYLSAAMADHDTCMNSLEESKATRKHLKDVKKQMEPIYKIISNSLCIVKDLVAKEEMRLGGDDGGDETDELFPATTHIPRRRLLWVAVQRKLSQQYCNHFSLLVVDKHNRSKQYPLSLFIMGQQKYPSNGSSCFNFSFSPFGFFLFLCLLDLAGEISPSQSLI